MDNAAKTRQTAMMLPRYQGGTNAESLLSNGGEQELAEVTIRGDRDARNRVANVNPPLVVRITPDSRQKNTGTWRPSWTSHHRREQGQTRNSRFAPEFLERRLSPTVMIPTPALIARMDDPEPLPDPNEPGAPPPLPRPTQPGPILPY